MVIGLSVVLALVVIGFIAMTVLVIENRDSAQQWMDETTKVKRELAAAQTALGTEKNISRMFQDGEKAAWRALNEATQNRSPQATLIDQVIEKEATELEHARAAYYRLTHALANDLSAETSGAGPLFSSSKFKVAEKALEWMTDSDAQTDWDNLHGWIADHPDQWEKLR